MIIWLCLPNRLIHRKNLFMKSLSLYIPVYSLTLLLSAALLFSVQPMFAKMILPLLGGTPQVWNTSMLFFQAALLGGYAYAHLGSKYLGIRAQALLHLALIIAFVCVLPFGVPADAAPPTASDPTLWQLSLMAGAVGGPFFVLAGSAPMLQRWFAATNHKDAGNPYFLYGASNLGSVTALLAYPVLVEPFLNLPAQAHIWKLGYVGLFCLTALSALIAWAHGQRANVEKAGVPAPPVTWNQRLTWLVLAFIPSSLMLGVTTFITSDVATVPLLWIAPLAMYVASFIIVFARKPIISNKQIRNIQALLIIALLVNMILQFVIDPYLLIALNFGLFFFSALSCHMELAAARPDARRLTEFYLVMSIGGALGGFLNAIIAPVFFIIPIEYALALAACAFMRYSVDSAQPLKKDIHRFKAFVKARGMDALFTWEFLLVFVIFFSALFSFSSPQNAVHYAAAAMAGAALLYFINRRWIFAVMTSLILFLFPPGYFSGNFLFKDILYRDSNFFGVIKVVDTVSGERILLHGVTNHGTQALDPKLRLTPLSYYGAISPIADVFRNLDRSPGRQNVAVLGLGAGVTACFSRKGRHFDFFEIDPAVIEVAQNTKYFTYLSDCRSPYDIIPGDGRLTLKTMPDHSYDVIVLDAFTSDNIPAHLLTIEAIEMYLRKLKPGGAVVFNITNNYLDIEPILAKAAEKLGIPGYARASIGKKIEGTQLSYYPADFFSFSSNARYNAYLEQAGWTKARFRPGVNLWTDQFSNIVMVLGNRTGFGRMEAELVKWKAEKAKKEQSGEKAP